MFGIIPNMLIPYGLMQPKNNSLGGIPFALSIVTSAQKLQTGGPMKATAFVSATALALSLLATGPSAAPFPPAGVPVAQELQAPKPPDTKVTDGKVTGIGKESFSIEVKNADIPQTVEFTLNSDTKIEGRLAVGLIAQVEYKTDGDKNIAVHVIVSAAE